MPPVDIGCAAFDSRFLFSCCSTVLWQSTVHACESQDSHSAVSKLTARVFPRSLRCVSGRRL